MVPDGSSSDVVSCVRSYDTAVTADCIRLMDGGDVDGGDGGSESLSLSKSASSISNSSRSRCRRFDRIKQHKNGTNVTATLNANNPTNTTHPPIDATIVLKGVRQSGSKKPTSHSYGHLVPCSPGM